MLTEDAYFVKWDENAKSYEDLKITFSSLQFQLSISN